MLIDDISVFQGTTLSIKNANKYVNEMRSTLMKTVSTEYTTYLKYIRVELLYVRENLQWKEVFIVFTEEGKFHMNTSDMNVLQIIT